MSREKRNVPPLTFFYNHFIYLNFSENRFAFEGTGKSLRIKNSNVELIEIVLPFELIKCRNQRKVYGQISLSINQGKAAISNSVGCCLPSEKKTNFTSICRSGRNWFSFTSMSKFTDRWRCTLGLLPISISTKLI